MNQFAIVWTEDGETVREMGFTHKAPALQAWEELKADGLAKRAKLWGPFGADTIQWRALDKGHELVMVRED